MSISILVCLEFCKPNASNSISAVYAVLGHKTTWNCERLYTNRATIRAQIDIVYTKEN